MSTLWLALTLPILPLTETAHPLSAFVQDPPLSTAALPPYYAGNSMMVSNTFSSEKKMKLMLAHRAPHRAYILTIMLVPTRW